MTEDTVAELVSQRSYGLCLGYEDLNDHDQLRHDPLLAVLAGKNDPKGEDHPWAEDRGKRSVGKSTLNRLELTPDGTEATAKEQRYKRIVVQ